MKNGLKELNLNDKLLLHGVESMSDDELITLWISCGSLHPCGNRVGRDLLANFDDLRGIRKAQAQHLCKVGGIGTTQYVLLHAMIELHKRSLGQKLEREAAFKHVDDVTLFVQTQFADFESEVFGILVLDSQHRLIKLRKMFFGTINAAAVYPRELVKQVLLDNGAALILVHNHPSGHAEPSQADIQLTREIKQAMNLIDVDVLDHFIVGDGAVVSFAQRGLL